MVEIQVKQSEKQIICAGDQENDHFNHQPSTLREDIKAKKLFNFGQCPNQLEPTPLPPIQTTWTSFSDVKNNAQVQLTILLGPRCTKIQQFSQFFLNFLSFSSTFFNIFPKCIFLNDDALMMRLWCITSGAAPLSSRLLSENSKKALAFCLPSRTDKLPNSYSFIHSIFQSFDR